MLSLGRNEEVLARISRDLNAYIGRAFEGISKEFLWQISEGRFSKIGRWWHRGEEIDFVALNESTKEIAFFECKWGSVSRKDAERIIADLKRKAALVQWHNGKRRERYGVIAKKIRGKEELRKSGILAFDLADFEEVVSTS